MNDEKKKVKRLYVIIGALAVVLIGTIAFFVGQQTSKPETPTLDEVVTATKEEKSKENELPQQENATKKDVKEVKEKAIQVYTFFEKEQPINEPQFEKFIKTFMTEEFKLNKYDKLKDVLRESFLYGTTLIGLSGSEKLNDPTIGWIQNLKIENYVTDEQTGTIIVFATSEDNFLEEKKTYWTEWTKENGEWKLYTTDFFEAEIPPLTDKQLNVEER